MNLGKSSNPTLQRLQILRRQLKLTEEVYRTILQAQGGASSSTAMDDAALRRVIGYLERTYKLPAPKKAPPKPFTQADKIAWLWKKVGEHGGLRDASSQALIAFIARTAGLQVSHPKLLPPPEASKVIEALKSMLDRAKRAERTAA